MYQHVAVTASCCGKLYVLLISMLLMSLVFWVSA